MFKIFFLFHEKYYTCMRIYNLLESIAADSDMTLIVFKTKSSIAVCCKSFSWKRYQYANVDQTSLGWQACVAL